MPFNIGRVFSEGVMAALARRGENRGGSARIRRDYGGQQGGQDDGGMGRFRAAQQLREFQADRSDADARRQDALAERGLRERALDQQASRDQAEQEIARQKLEGRGQGGGELSEKDRFNQEIQARKLIEQIQREAMKPDEAGNIDPAKLEDAKQKIAELMRYIPEFHNAPQPGMARPAPRAGAAPAPNGPFSGGFGSGPLDPTAMAGLGSASRLR